MFPFVVANRSGVPYLLGSIDIYAILCNEIFDTYAFFAPIKGVSVPFNFVFATKECLTNE